jgi:hypothetical protein
MGPSFCATIKAVGSQMQPHDKQATWMYRLHDWHEHFLEIFPRLRRYVMRSRMGTMCSTLVEFPSWEYLTFRVVFAQVQRLRLARSLHQHVSLLDRGFRGFDHPMQGKSHQTSCTH